MSNLAVNTIKMLAVDAIEKANSGHPGLPMGMADVAFVLWNRFLKYSAADPNWPNRDRFVLSGGHGSMLLYSLLHLSGFDLSIDDLKNFRQWESKTPGHPESFRTPGVETTTGPLGQGAANAVGMALAAKMMGARFNRADFSPIDHFVYAVVTDGDMMEGVASEAASLAGHLGLGNLIFLYDDNRITIDGKTAITFTENVADRFAAYGWHTQNVDGYDHEGISRSIDAARAEKNRPSLIVARTHIGQGSPNRVDTPKAHGSPLGKEETELTKKALGWPTQPTFLVPDEVRALFKKRTDGLETERKNWEGDFARWKGSHPDLAKDWDRLRDRNAKPELFEELVRSLPAMPDATRSISGKLEQIVAKHVPGFVGGAADLNESTKTEIHGSPIVTPEDFTGRNIAFGIREHAMGALQNGFAYYGGFIPFGSTFLIFSDYMRPAIRVAALARLQSIYVFTHDSVFLGEDGPTHQAVEQLSALRMIPNLAVVRPADSLECAAAWQIAIDRASGPTAIALTRQKLGVIDRDAAFQPKEALKGAYVAFGREITNPAAIVIGTGSELQLAMGAAKNLKAKGIEIRVLSMPCAELFEQQPKAYRDQVLPPGAKVAAIEAGRTTFWHKYTGRNGLIIGIDRFGESAPDTVLAEKFGFTVPAVTERLQTWLKLVI